MGRFIIILIEVLILMSLIQADTTFFDNEEEVFILGNSMITSSEITGIINENELNAGGSCLTNWICGSWSDCINNVQLRNCAKEKEYCYANLNEKPIERKICSVKKQKTEVTTEKENKGIKIFIIALIIIAIAIFISYKIFRKIRNYKYGY